MQSPPEPITAPSSVLGSQETPVPDVDSPELSTRSRVLGAFTRLEVPLSRKLSFESCGTGVWLLRSTTDPNLYRFAADRCKDRLCPACQRSRAHTIRANLEPRITGRDIRFLTLTLRADDTNLAQRLKRLYASFRLLRRRPLWKDRATGGLACCEVTYNRDSGNWNVHLHLLVEGRYIALADLKAEWLACTGDSSHVDIQRPRETCGVLKYVTKYVTKPTDIDNELSPLRLDEYVHAIGGHKLVFTFGSWRRWSLLAHPTLAGWTLLCHYNEIFYRADITAEQVQAIVAARELYFRTRDDYTFSLPTTQGPAP